MKYFSVALVISVVIAIGYFQSDADNKTVSTEKKSQSRKTLTKTNYPLDCLKGQVNFHKLSYRANGKLSGFKVSPNTAPVDAATKLEFAAETSTICNASDNEAFEWQMKLKVSSIHQESVGQLQYDKEQLELPFQVRWNFRSGIVDAAFADSITRENRFVLMDLISHLSFSWLQSPTQPNKWTAKESYNSGKKTVHYALHSEGNQIVLQKTMAGAKNDESYIADYSFKGGALKSFKLSYSQNKVLSTGASLRNESAIELEYLRSKKSKPIKTGFPKWISTSSFADSETIEKIYANELGKLSANDLLNSIHQLNQKEKITEYYKKYKSLFYLQKESVDLFLDALKSLPEGDDKYQVLTLAMIKAGHPFIQDFLVEKILRSPSVSNAKKITTMGLMGMLNSPTPKTIKSVLDIAKNHDTKDVRHSGWLSVGNMTRKIANTAPEVRDIVSEELISKAKKDKTPSDKLDTVHTAGNIGDARHFSLVEKSLAAPDLTRKQAALLSLRFMNPEKAQPIFVRYMLDEADESLALTAFEAASFQELTPMLLKHLVETSASAKKEQLRLAALQLLKQKYDEAPATVRAAIDQAARYDTSLRVQQFASSLILSL